MKERLVAGFAAALLLLAFARSSVAGPPLAAVRGTVREVGGRPLGGALVTLAHRELRRATTVYTDREGRFVFPPLDAGSYDLRVRRWGYEDVVRKAVPIGHRPAEFALEMAPLEDPREKAWQLPASSWLALVTKRLSRPELREEFVRQCTFCHQQGNWATRVVRAPEEWEKIFLLMARMGGVISGELRSELPEALDSAYEEESYLAALRRGELEPLPVEESIVGTVVTEWELGHPASMQHDLVVHPDGRIYSVDTNQDRLYRLDPRTNERRSWTIPRGDSPLGGVFHASGALLAPNSNAHVAPHSLQVAPDGSLWITLCLGNKIARFDPVREAWSIFVQKDGLYPHTLRFDSRGRAWYTLAVSNHVGVIDPATGEQRTIRLPARDWGQEVAVRLVPVFLWVARFLPEGFLTTNASEGVDLPVPYGIDVAPDGSVWFSQLNEHRIGRIDPDTFEVEMFETPFPGPRRLRFDSRGNLWIPGFSSGVVARYEIRTGKFRSWKLPVPGVETPYALAVDKRTDTVWICGTNSDSLVRFEPEEERFTVFPLPTRVTYTREIDFDEAGGVWTSNSNFPTWQIEGGLPKVIRLLPASRG
ncbi:MAG: hypothetical protein KatS3mg076_2313 [Candidatus Binatia bacterium]|nr:MAG: hypothetical protein KatS3mg076_2313 [Candidatus Binatia bacterium]